MSRNDAPKAKAGPLMRAFIEGKTAATGAMAGAGAVDKDHSRDTQPRLSEAAVPPQYLGGSNAFVSANGRAHYSYGGFAAKSVHESDYTDSDADTFAGNPYARRPLAMGTSAAAVAAPRSLGVAASSSSTSSREDARPAAQMPAALAEAPPLAQRGRAPKASASGASEESLGEGAPSIVPHIRTRYSRARSLTQTLPAPSLAPPPVARSVSARRRKSLTVRFSPEALELALQTEAAAAEAALVVEALVAEAAAAEVRAVSEEELGEEILVEEVEAAEALAAEAEFVARPAAKKVAEEGLASQELVEEVEPRIALLLAPAAAPAAPVSFKIHRVRGDGACLFTAVRNALFEFYQAHASNPYADLSGEPLRAQVVQHIENNRELYGPSVAFQLETLLRGPEYELESLASALATNPTEILRLKLEGFRNRLASVPPEVDLEEEISAYMIGEGWSHYINALKVPTMWGGDLELRAISELLSLQIVVHYTRDQNRDSFVIGDGIENCVYLLFDGTHYNFLSLNPPEDTPSHEIFRPFVRGASRVAEPQRVPFLRSLPVKGGAGRPEDADVPEAESKDTERPEVNVSFGSTGASSGSTGSSSADQDSSKEKGDSSPQAEVDQAFNKQELELLDRLIAEMQLAVTGPQKKPAVLKKLLPNYSSLKLLAERFSERYIEALIDIGLVDAKMAFLELREEQGVHYLLSDDRKNNPLRKIGKMFSLEELQAQLKVLRPSSIQESVADFITQNSRQLWRWTASGSLEPFTSDRLTKLTKGSVDSFQADLEKALEEQFQLERNYLLKNYKKEWAGIINSKLPPVSPEDPLHKFYTASKNEERKAFGGRDSFPGAYTLLEYLPESDIDAVYDSHRRMELTARLKNASDGLDMSRPARPREVRGEQYEHIIETHRKALQERINAASEKIAMLQSLLPASNTLFLMATDADLDQAEKEERKKLQAYQDQLLIQEAIKKYYEAKLSLSNNLVSDLRLVRTQQSVSSDPSSRSDLEHEKHLESQFLCHPRTAGELRVRALQSEGAFAALAGEFFERQNSERYGVTGLAPEVQDFLINRGDELKLILIKFKLKLVQAIREMMPIWESWDIAEPDSADPLEQKKLRAALRREVIQRQAEIKTQKIALAAEGERLHVHYTALEAQSAAQIATESNAFVAAYIDRFKIMLGVDEKKANEDWAEYELAKKLPVPKTREEETKEDRAIAAKRLAAEKGIVGWLCYLRPDLRPAQARQLIMGGIPLNAHERVSGNRNNPLHMALSNEPESYDAALLDIAIHLIDMGVSVDESNVADRVTPTALAKAAADLAPKTSSPKTPRDTDPAYIAAQIYELCLRAANLKARSAENEEETSRRNHDLEEAKEELVVRFKGRPRPSALSSVLFRLFTTPPTATELSIFELYLDLLGPGRSPLLISIALEGLSNLPKHVQEAFGIPKFVADFKKRPELIADEKALESFRPLHERAIVSEVDRAKALIARSFVALQQHCLVMSRELAATREEVVVLKAGAVRAEAEMVAQVARGAVRDEEHAKTKGELAAQVARGAKTEGELAETRGELAETRGELAETRGKVLELETTTAQLVAAFAAMQAKQEAQESSKPSPRM